MKATIFSLVFTALTGIVSGLAIKRDDFPLDVSIGGGIAPINAPATGLNISVGGAIGNGGSPNDLPPNITRRSYQPQAPYADPHTINPLNFVDSGELCEGHLTYEDGDYYCQKIDQVIYTNVAHTGEYQEVEYMNEETGECRFAAVNRTFAGEMAPFNEPVTLIFRGPIHLKQLAIYHPTGSSYTRNHHYHAASQSTSGLTFLGNRGGEGSGVVGDFFGASLSYINPTASGGSSSPQVLANEVITNEFLVYTDQDCDSGSGSCGYVRPNAVAKKGFPGGTFMVLLEFSMPHTGGDKPAIWLENARVPYTQQYGGCSCWTSGCGEFDIFEILHEGYERAETTFHLDVPAGDPNWFPRPTDRNAPIKVAVWFDGPVNGGTASVKMLGTSDGKEFGRVLSEGEVREFKKRSEGLVSEIDYARRRGPVPV
ncbi:putative TOS1-like glycosyl hydrolase-domain-containing protein [Sordaria brevicollis]|uniref:glucan endo-1,3-beta-D-glucosidase n=1 Tax=Sordaria brevicollis TaxID=83679 RepID=A0AAE0PB12_SORBR|nr:putative TOS1-like glycosyl hydrolase-domain-containing protein [Sordaria brevicollis]